MILFRCEVLKNYRRYSIEILCMICIICVIYRFKGLECYTFQLRFIRRQVNEVGHNFARVASRHASFQIHIRISSCISTIIIMNEMQ